MAKKKVDLTVSVEKVGKGGVMGLATIEIEMAGNSVTVRDLEIRRWFDGGVRLLVPRDHPMAGLLNDFDDDIGLAIFASCPELRH